MSAAIRVTVNDDGTVDLLDFGVPPDSQRVQNGVKQEDVAPWIMESISMLRIAKTNDHVLGLGFKISDTVYYVSNQEGESYE
jgi:hypothetical protein